MIKWNIIKSEAEWKQAVESSHSSPIAVFKHSTRCPTSFMAKRSFESSWAFDSSKVQPYFLDLIAFRPISHLIATDTGVHHESPQLIVMNQGKVVHHASHHEISTDSIKPFIA